MRGSLAAPSAITYGDKLLPSQPFFRHLYRGALPFETALHVAVSAFTGDCAHFRCELSPAHFEEMSTPPWQIRTLELLIRLTGAKSVLEIGTYIGNTALHLARMVGRDGHVTTLERGREFAQIARENIRRSELAAQINLIEGDAGAILNTLPDGAFDFIFVDGSKQDYLSYVLKCGRLLADRGVIVVDDVFFHGDALNEEPQTDKGKGCRALLEHFKTDYSFERCILPVGNGMLVLWRA